MSDEVSVVFEQVETGVFKPVRLEEEVEGHLRRARDDLSSISLEPVEGSEPLFRISVAGDDDVAGHSGHALFYYVLKRPPEPRRPAEEEVRGHVGPPTST